MLVSTRGRYGVRALYELAAGYGSGPIPMKEIARRQGLSEHYLEQLMGALRRAGLIHSVRGAQGGYVLAREPAEISVGDVLRVLEGPLSATGCAEDETGAGHCGRAEGCVARDVWVRVHDGIREVVDSISLEDICADCAGAASGGQLGEAE